MGDVPVVDVEDVQARLAGRFGPEVAGWCAGLPALAGEVAGRWGLRLGRAWPTGGTSVALPCESGAGEPLVLKLTPDPKIAADEATELDAWLARGHVVTLHDADPDRGALLLERVLPGTRLADEPGRGPLGAPYAPLSGGGASSCPAPGASRAHSGTRTVTARACSRSAPSATCRGYLLGPRLSGIMYSRHGIPSCSVDASDTGRADAERR